MSAVLRGNACSVDKTDSGLFFCAWMGNILVVFVRNWTSIWIKDGQALTLPCFKTPKSLPTITLQKILCNAKETYDYPKNWKNLHLLWFCMQSLMNFGKTASKTNCTKHQFETYSLRSYFISNACHSNCRVDVDINSFGLILPRLYGQSVIEEWISFWFNLFDIESSQVQYRT